MIKKHGYIYILKSNFTDNVYIGSTTEKYCSSRFSKHRDNYRKFLNNKYNYCTSFEILKYDDCYMEQLDYKENINKHELHLLEKHYINNNNNCINKNYNKNITTKDTDIKKRNINFKNLEQVKEQKINFYLADIDKIKKKILKINPSYIF